MFSKVNGFKINYGGDMKMLLCSVCSLYWSTQLKTQTCWTLVWLQTFISASKIVTENAQSDTSQLQELSSLQTMW